MGILEEKIIKHLPETKEFVMNFVSYYRQEGRQEGLQLGIQKGRQEGRQEGLQEGLQEGRQMVARALLAKGIDLSIISTATEISLEDLLRLKLDQ